MPLLFRRKHLDRLLAAHEREFEAARRERAELLDRIQYLAGKTWRSPPTSPPVEQNPDKLEELVAVVGDPLWGDDE